jgi:hypothetical protein
MPANDNSPVIDTPVTVSKSYEELYFPEVLLNTPHEGGWSARAIVALAHRVNAQTVELSPDPKHRTYWTLPNIQAAAQADPDLAAWLAAGVGLLAKYAKAAHLPERLAGTWVEPPPAEPPV